MAKVPVVTRNLVDRAPITNAKFSAPDMGASPIAAGLRDLGEGMQDAAEAQQRLRDLYDDAATKKLYNIADARVRETLWTGEDAYFNKQGLDATAARPKVEQQLRDLRSELLNQAKNQRQKDMFGQAYDRMVGQELGTIARYEREEVRKEETRQSAARMLSLQDNAVRYADDPELFAGNFGAALNELRNQKDRNGWSDETLAAEEAKFRSSVHAAIVHNKARTDVGAAKSYLDAHRGEIDWKVEQDLDDALQAPLEARETKADVDSVMGMATADDAPEVPYSDPLRGRGTGVSSGFGAQRATGSHSGVDFTGKVGTPIYSMAPGVVKQVSRDDRAGIFVVVDHGGGRTTSYAHMEGADVKVGQEITPDTRLGRIGMTGNTTGPHVHVVMRENGTRVDPQKVIGKARQSPREHDLNWTFAELDARAARGKWTPERLERAKAEAERRVNRDEGLLKRQQDAAGRDALDHVDRLGDRFTDISQVPSSILSRMSAADRIQLKGQAKANAKPKEVPANGDSMLALNLMSTLDKKRFLQTDLRLYRHQMTPGEFKSLALLQAQQRANPESPPVVQHEAIWSMINRYAPDMNLTTGKKAKDGDRQKTARIFSMMQADLNRTTAKEKRPPTDDEVKAAFDRATMSVTVPDAGWFGADRTMPRYEVKPGTAVRVAVPKTARDAIVQAYRRRLGRNPAEGEVVQAYVRLKGVPGVGW